MTRKQKYKKSYMAEALLDKVLGKLGNEEEGVKAYEVLETYTGKAVSYTHLNSE